MVPQDVLSSINTNINIIFAVIVAFVVGPAAFIAGRVRGRGDATSEVHNALDRAARDVRMFYNRGVSGVTYGPFAEKVLKEAEYIVRWRSYGANYLERPTGHSRMRPSGELRSVQKRREREALRLRNEIFSWGNRTKPDDTYAGPLKNVVHRRYE